MIYEEYESIINLPVKADKYKSFFKITKIFNDEDTQNKLSDNEYKLRLDTLTYYDKDDTSIQYQLKKGDLLVEFDNMPITNIEELKESISKHKKNAEVTIKYCRNNEIINTKIKLNR